MRLFCLLSHPFPPSLVDLVSIGLVSISTDLVSVTVPGGWLPLAELPWIPGCLLKACGSRLVASPRTSAHFIRHHPQAYLLAMSLNVVISLFCAINFSRVMVVVVETSHRSEEVALN